MSDKKEYKKPETPQEESRDKQARETEDIIRQTQRDTKTSPGTTKHLR